MVSVPSVKQLEVRLTEVAGDKSAVNIEWNK